MMTEMLNRPTSESNKSPNRRKINKNLLASYSSSTRSLSPIRDKIIVPESMIVGNHENKVRISPRRMLVIPETQDISPKRFGALGAVECDILGKPLSENQLQRTPKKDECKKRIEDLSPILDRSTKRKKVLSLRSENEIQKSLINLPEEFLLNIANDGTSSLPTVSDSNSSKQKSPPTVLHNIRSPVPSTSKVVSPGRKKSTRKEKPNNKWSLKPSRNLDDDVQLKADKKLKQTTLSLKPVEIKKDITKLKSFNGGVHSISSEIINDDEEVYDVKSDDDIVFSSPCEKKSKQNIGIENASCISRQKLKKNVPPKEELESMDVTMFNPIATSTCKMDSSFDKIPGRESRSPTFKYQRDAVKKKSERMQLEGWDCDHCAKYYQAAGKGLKPHEVKKLMNRCSRHRNKYPVRANTPPGFWDPDFPPSDSEDDSDDKVKRKR